MAQLPNLQNGAGILSVPESNPAALASAPYTAIAEATAFLGNRLEKAIEPEMRAAGAEAVVRDADGNLQVRQRVEWMEADRAFNVGARQAFEIEFRDETSRGLRAMAREYQGRPQEFGAAADAFVRERLRQAPREMRPFLTAPLMQESRQLHDGIADQRLRVDQQRIVNTFKAEDERLSADIASIVFNGGSGTDEYRLAVQRQRDLRLQMVQNPTIAYTPEQMAQAERADLVRDVTQDAAGRAYRQFQKDGDLAKAEEIARSAAMDPRLQLSAEERAKIMNDVTVMIRTGRAAQAEHIANLTERGRVLLNQIRSGGTFNDGEVDDLAGQFRGVKRHSAAIELEGARVAQVAVREWDGANPSQRVGILTRLRGKAGGVTATPEERQAFDYFAGQGLSTVQVAAVVSYMLQESTLNPNARNPRDGRDGSDSVGMGQWNAERAQALQAFAAARGSSPNDRQTQFAFLMHELNTTEKAAGDRLRAATTPEEATAAMVAFGRPGGYTPGPDGHLGVPSWGSRLANTQRISGIGPQTQLYSEALRELQKRADSEAERAVGEVEKAVAAGQRVTDEQLTEALQMVSLSSDRGKRDQFLQKLGDAEVQRLVRQMPPEQGREVLERLTARVEAGEGGPAAQRAQRVAAAAVQARAEAVAADPVQSTISRLREGPARDAAIGPQPVVVDLSTPETFSTSLDQRMRAARHHEAYEGSGAVSPLSAADAQAVGTALGRADMRTLPDLLQVLARRVPDSNLDPLLRQAPIRNALDALARSADPTKLAATMQFLDAAEKRLGATRFADVVGEKAKERLDDWQRGGKDEDPVIFADRWSRADDPQVRAAREEHRKAGEDIARKEFSANEIADLVAGRWFGSIRPSIAPAPRLDDRQVSVMTADWVRFLGQEYAAADGDRKRAVERATERMRQLWGPSDVNFGRVMRRRPETVYEPVNGSHDWMRAQLNAALVEQLGRERIAMRPDEIPEMAGSPMVRYGVVADGQTEAEVSAYRRNPQGALPPSYMVYYEHPITKALAGFRMRFDHAAALAPQRAEDARRSEFQSGINQVTRDPRMPAYNQTVGGVVEGAGDRPAAAPPNEFDQAWSSLRRSDRGDIIDPRSQTGARISRQMRGQEP